MWFVGLYSNESKNSNHDRECKNIEMSKKRCWIVSVVATDKAIKKSFVRIKVFKKREDYRYDNKNHIAI